MKEGPRREGPQLHQVVGTGGGEQRSVTVDGQGADRLCVPRQLGPQSPRGHVPEQDALVDTAVLASPSGGDEQRAIGGEGDRVDPVAVAGQHVLLLAGTGVAQDDEAVLPTRGQRRPVGAVRGGSDGSRMSTALQLVGPGDPLAGGESPLGDITETGRGQNDVVVGAERDGAYLAVDRAELLAAAPVLQVPDPHDTVATPGHGGGPVAQDLH